MADTSVEEVDSLPDWHLMAEFVMTELIQSKQNLETLIVEATQVLNVPPARLEQVYETMIQALNRLERSTKLADRLPVVRIRLWSSSAKADCGGWGFYLVERSGTTFPHDTAEATHFMDLYLYLEQGPNIQNC